jgi:hypothetical protein
VALRSHFVLYPSQCRDSQASLTVRHHATSLPDAASGEFRSRAWTPLASMLGLSTRPDPQSRRSMGLPRPPGSPITLRTTGCRHTLPAVMASRRCADPGRAVRTHPFTPYGRARPGKTPVRTALSPRYLIRPPWPGAATRDENRASPAELGSPWCGRAPWYTGDFRFRMRPLVQVQPGPPHRFSCGNARPLPLLIVVAPVSRRAQRSQNASLHYCAIEQSMD